MLDKQHHIPKTISIIVADDHTLILHGLRSLLSKTPDIKLLLECDNGVDALNTIRIHKPDVAVLDISMPGMDGITVAANILDEKLPTSIIILSTHDDPVLFVQATNVGAKAYVLKNNAFEVLIDSIRQVAAGKQLLSNPITHLQESPRTYILTDREREVLALIANGLTNRMIAENLKISINTVDRHRSNLMFKLGLHSTAELVRYAIKTGVI